jgi:hypothetical protein
MTYDYLFTQTFNKEGISCPAFHPELTQQPISCPAFHPDFTPPPDNTENKEIKISQFTRDFFYHHNKPVWFN